MNRRRATLVSYGLMTLGVSVIAVLGLAEIPTRPAFGVGLVGAILLLSGIAWSVRKGDELQHHPQYNSRSGKIQASTPYAWFANKVRGPRYRYSPPKRATLSRRRMTAQGLITAYFMSVVGLVIAGVPKMFYIGGVIVSLLISIAVSQFLYRRFEDTGNPSEEPLIEEE